MDFKITCWFSILPVLFISTAVASSNTKDYSALLSSSRCYPMTGTNSKKVSSYTCKNDNSVKIKAQSPARKEGITRSSRESRDRHSSVL